MLQARHALRALLCLLSLSAVSLEAAADERPNILLIVADDLGYADLGAYGSEIRTPNIDSLAAEGLILTQFHTSPMCAATRAMLLTGNNNHVAGMARQNGSRMLDVNVPGYEAHLSDRVAPMPKLLREAGYHTYTAGKWHLGTAPEHGPAAAGFERSFSLLHGAGSHFGSTGFFEGGSLYSADGVPVEYPEGRYTTELFTNRLIEFMDVDRGDGQPFFALAAYTSPHWPLQIPADYLDRYAGRYAAGYDRLREQRMDSLRDAGIIPESWTLPPRDDAITPWVDLTAQEQRRESRKMELYAAMVENLDFHVGRLVQYLKATGRYDNTLIVFMSDNGAAGADFFHASRYAEFLQTHYDNAYENMGRPTSWVSYGRGWAEAGSAPFSRRKTYTREGGIVAPMIIAGPGVTAAGGIDSAYLTVMDLAPTFLEVAGASYPSAEQLAPMLGESLVPFLAGERDRMHDDDYVTTLYHGGRAFVRRGRWKLVNLDRPFDESEMELFDVLADPGETRDRSADEPEVRAEMIELWRRTRRELGIVLPEDL